MSAALASIKGKSTMISANHSVHPGVGANCFVGSRAVLLSFVAVLVLFASCAVVHAEPAAESTAAVSEPAKTIAPAAELGEHIPITDETVAAKIGEPTFHRIGPVTTVTEVSSGLPFPARVDTGATTCSIHYEAIEIEDAAESPADNVGKRVRILIKSPDGEQEWISTKIVGRVRVRTTTDEDERYKVQLKLRWQDVEKKVLVTLNDRDKMKYPLLLGRNFLRGDFLVDVDLVDEK
jgi:hypothetical protein